MVVTRHNRGGRIVSCFWVADLFHFVVTKVGVGRQKVEVGNQKVRVKVGVGRRSPQ